jgi:hypothetical protein
MTGTTIQLFKYGETTPTITVTDSSITAAGTVGLRVVRSVGTPGSDGPQLYNLSADDGLSSGTPTTSFYVI